MDYNVHIFWSLEHSLLPEFTIYRNINYDYYAHVFYSFCFREIHRITLLQKSQEGKGLMTPNQITFYYLLLLIRCTPSLWWVYFQCCFILTVLIISNIYIKNLLLGYTTPQFQHITVPTHYSFNTTQNIEFPCVFR